MTGSSITLRPMGDRVLIRPIEDKKVTDSGLHIPDNAAPEAGAKRGMVLAVGRGDKLGNGERAQMFCRPGDRVFYRANPNQEWEIEFEDGKKDKCAVINEEQFVLAIIDRV